MEDYGYKYYSDFLSGDPCGFEQIVKLYRENLILFIQQYVRDYQSAEDVSQDVFVKLYLKKPHYSPKASFKTWLYTIAKREALNHLKKQKREADVDEAAFGNYEEEYLEPILSDERKITLHRALDELTPEYRRALYLCYFEDMAVNEIAKLLNKRPAQISDMLYNAKKALKAVIMKGGSKYEILRTGTE